MPTKAEPAEAEPWGEDDRLEPPGVQTRTLLMLGAGFLGFVAVSLALLVVFFRAEAPDYGSPPPRTFPDPRLETNSDPRSMPAVQPGAALAPRAFPTRTPASAQDLQRAMAVMAAEGAQAYDSPDGETAAHANASSAQPAQARP